MKTTIQILPGIKAIGWCDAKHLPRRVDLAGICGMPVAILTDIHYIDFFGDPSCECTTKKEAAGYTDTTTLKFDTGGELPSGTKLAFIVTDVSNNSYLIGSREYPWTTIERQRTMGVPSGDSCVISYEIKHISLKSMIPCIV